MELRCQCIQLSFCRGDPRDSRLSKLSVLTVILGTTLLDRRAFFPQSLPSYQVRKIFNV
jgi:hypothetical protein